APSRGLRWIDVGCGSGAFTELLVERCALVEVEGITDDLVAGASGITGVARRQAPGFQVATGCFDKKASDWEVATRLPWAQTGPVTIFYGRGGRRIQAPRALITMIVRQVGADNEQCFRAAPQSRQHLRDLVRGGVANDKRQQ